MEQNEEEIASTMDVVVVADKEDVVERPTVPTSPTATIEGGAAAANEQVAKTVFASEEQFRSVFSNDLVSSKPNVTLHFMPQSNMVRVELNFH